MAICTTVAGDTDLKIYNGASNQCTYTVGDSDDWIVRSPTSAISIDTSGSLHITGNQTVTGTNTFTNNVIIDGTATTWGGAGQTFNGTEGATVTGQTFNGTGITYAGDDANIFVGGGNISFGSEYVVNFPEIGSREHKRNEIRKKAHFNIIRQRGNLIQSPAVNELVAIETLREEITESEFRKYMKFGFINVYGLSGKIYQIFRNQTHVKVWEHGKVIEEVCVYIPDSTVPPTDKVIAFKVMIETDELEFKLCGNVYNMRKVA